MSLIFYDYPKSGIKIFIKLFMKIYSFIISFLFSLKEEVYVKVEKKQWVLTLVEYIKIGF